MRSVLHRNQEGDILIIDIPTSIAEAQNFDDISLKLLSCSPLNQPWSSTDPKSEKAKARLGRAPSYEIGYQRVIEAALDSLQAAYQGPFCLPRKLPSPNISLRKRHRSESPTGTTIKSSATSSKFDRRDVDQNLASTLHNQSSNVIHKTGNDVTQRLISNIMQQTVRLSVEDNTTFLLPPQSSFFSSDCNESRIFHQAIQQKSKTNGSASQFNVIVMDPPWPNKSVTRGHRQGQAQYDVSDSMWEMRQLLFDIDISPLLTSGGIVAVWITNKPAVRELVLSEEDGLFSSWGVELVEEWIWVKITTRGRPVLPVDGVWRQPYEVLLVGRKTKNSAPPPTSVVGKGGDVLDDEKKRVIFAVPDLHSRKPCVKKLLQEIFNLPEDHQGLEVFARNLISGWTSWGNQVLKFNNVNCWSSGKEADEDDPDEAGQKE